MPLFLVIRKDDEDLIPSLEVVVEEEIKDQDGVMVYKQILCWSEDPKDLAEFEEFLKVLLKLDLFFNGIHEIVEEAFDTGRVLGKQKMFSGRLHHS